MEIQSRIGLVGLEVKGQNLALNIAFRGFPISVYDETNSKVDETVMRAKREGHLPLYGFSDHKAFISSLCKPCIVIMIVKPGETVDETISTLIGYMEPGDCLIDGSNEWFGFTNIRQKAMAMKGYHYLGMGISGDEMTVRHGPSLMPGGSFEAYKLVEEILQKIAAKDPDNGVCVRYIGDGGYGHFVHMIYNEIVYAGMQLVSQSYDVLKYVGKLQDTELEGFLGKWNEGVLISFIRILKNKERDGEKHLIDEFLKKAGMEKADKFFINQLADSLVAAPSLATCVDSRYVSRLKDERVEAANMFKSLGLSETLSDHSLDKKMLVCDVEKSLYASMLCSYAQGMKLIQEKSVDGGLKLTLRELAQIWKGMSIFGVTFLDHVTKAYDANPDLPNLLMDREFVKEVVERQSAWRRVVCFAVNAGVSIPGMSSTLAYFDAYRRG